MLFFALDREKIIFPEQAVKGKDYKCPECNASLRIKEGSYRKKHFFHLYRKPYCRQREKDWTHIVIQKKLLSFIPQGKLEYRFPVIQRVADFACIEEKVIFEIQCSPISLEEIQSRNHDYASLGFTVIWILHDKRFNQKIVSPAEYYLRFKGSFYTSINCAGQGIFYDQRESFSKRKRIWKSNPILIRTFFPLPKLQIPTILKIKHAIIKKILNYIEEYFLHLIYKNSKHIDH